jgi:hypothetical protein
MFKKEALNRLECYHSTRDFATELFLKKCSETTEEDQEDAACPPAGGKQAAFRAFSGSG